MKDFFRQPLFLVFVIIAILIVVGWNLWSSTRSSKTATTETTTSSSVSSSDLTNVEPADFNETTKSEFILALSKAQEVDTNYKMSALEIELDSTFKPDTVVSRYIFSSESDPNNNWAITISAINSNYIRALIPKNDYLGNVSPIDLSLWKFNYVTAFQIAETNGGRSWRLAQGNTFQKVTLTLKNIGVKNWLTWVVGYTSQNSSTQIKIDAYTGQVIQ